jgi:hypothetical protein
LKNSRQAVSSLIDTFALVDERDEIAIVIDRPRRGGWRHPVAVERQAPERGIEQMGYDIPHVPGAGQRRPFPVFGSKRPQQRDDVPTQRAE